MNYAYQQSDGQTVEYLHKYYSEPKNELSYNTMFNGRNKNQSRIILYDSIYVKLKNRKNHSSILRDTFEMETECPQRGHKEISGASYILDLDRVVFILVYSVIIMSFSVLKL